MADISVTASAVIAGNNVVKKTETAGATITAGQTVYWDSATRTIKLADCDSGTSGDPIRTVKGIALNSASSGQPITYALSGDITFNSVLTAGVAYYQSGTAGGICPVADVASGDDVVVLGIAKSATVLALDIQNPAIELA